MHQNQKILHSEVINYARTTEFEVNIVDNKVKGQDSKRVLQKINK